MPAPLTDPTQPLIEAVPNFSEGRDLGAVEAIANAIGNSPGAMVLDLNTDPDHNRAVVTAVATPPEAIVDALFAGVAEAVARLNIRDHKGVHPRVGVADVVPLVPIRSVDLMQAATLATALAQRIGADLQVPVFLYEAAATRPERKVLSYIRNRGWEFLEQVLGSGNPEWTPDYGPHRLHPTAGACVVGARDFLVAFNINLACSDLSIAKGIAQRIRATAPDGLPGIRALGFPVEGQGCVQVSVNVTDYRQTTLEKVYEWVERLATMHGVKILDTELVGLIPEAATTGYDLARLRIRDWAPDRVLESRITALAGV